jgi:hypothetical protein
MGKGVSFTWNRKNPNSQSSKVATGLSPGNVLLKETPWEAGTTCDWIMNRKSLILT